MDIEKFARAFVPDRDGSWFCREPVQIRGPNGALTTTPGVTYRRGKLVNGYDVAQWLEDWAKHQARPPGIEFF